MKNTLTLILISILILCLSCNSLFAQKRKKKKQTQEPVKRPWVFDSKTNTLNLYYSSGTKRLKARYKDGILLPFHTESWNKEGKPLRTIVRDENEKVIQNIYSYTNSTETTDINPETNKAILKTIKHQDGSSEVIRYAQQGKTDSSFSYFPDKKLAHVSITITRDTALLRLDPFARRKKLIRKDSSYAFTKHLNSWNIDGEQECKNGNGLSTDYYFKSATETSLYNHTDIATIRMTRMVKAGKFHGSYSYFDRNGKLAFSGIYHNNTMGDTLWVHNRETGEKESVIDFGLGDDWRTFANKYEADFPKLARLLYREPKDVIPKIRYPGIAREANIEGEYVVKGLIDEKGKLITFYPIQFAHPILMEAVDQHITKLHFNGRHETFTYKKYWVNIPFTFRLLN
ncbi:MAG: hypothetical protein AB8F95_14155 [Bacteroidia bacterium]